MLVFSGIETENEEKTREAILHELREIQDGACTQDTLDTSVRSLCDTIRGYTDSPDVLCAWYGNQILNGTVKTPVQRISEIGTVTLPQVRTAAEAVTLDTVFMLAGTGEEHHE
jgi:predicted Zn-dependent peptidase